MPVPYAVTGGRYLPRQPLLESIYCPECEHWFVAGTREVVERLFETSTWPRSETRTLTKPFLSDMAWTLNLPHGEIVTPNSRSHWSARSRCAKTWREAAAVLACAEGVPHLDRIAVRLEHWPKDKRRRDPDRNSLVAKWCLDGLVDADVIDDDDAAHVAEVSLRLHPPRPDRQPTWLLTIEEAA